MHFKKEYVNCQFCEERITGIERYYKNRWCCERCWDKNELDYYFWTRKCMVADVTIEELPCDKL